jgi:endonuclease G
VPPQDPDLGKFVNEGIRVSRIVKHIRAHAPSARQKLVDGLFGREQRISAPPSTVLGAALGSVTVPLEVSVRLGNGASPTPSAAAVEAIRIDPDYRTRRGYDSNFLGGGARRVPLPKLNAAQRAGAAINSQATGEGRYLLPYHNFSIAQDRERRLAIFTAVNIDGASSRRLKRERDRWIFDPRIPEDEQTGTDVYEGNDLDLGHLVRRLDPAWGETKAAAKRANDDTFHLTNCTPQHKDFNRNQTRWAGLEDYILEHADNLNFRVSVFTGPVLADSDDSFNGVQLPRQYWKVVTMVKAEEDGGTLSATGYLLSQKHLIDELELAPEAFSYGAYRTYQVPITRIEQLTGLSFGTLSDHDPLAQDDHEAALASAREIERTDEIVL